MSWWVGDLAHSGRYVELLSWIFWVLLSITLHELGHGWAAIRQGDDTPLKLNRMTLNPVTHMGLNSLIIFALCGIAWGQMPVNRYRFRDGRRGDILVSAAGPATNLLIAAVLLVALTLWLRVVPTATTVSQLGAKFLYLGVGLNLILAPFNLLPVPPLDGARILAGFSRRARQLYEHPHAPMIGLFVFIVIFFMTPVGSIFIGWAWSGAVGLVDGLGALVGNPGIREAMYGRGA